MTHVSVVLISSLFSNFSLPMVLQDNESCIPGRIVWGSKWRRLAKVYTLTNRAADRQANRVATMYETGGECCFTGNLNGLPQAGSWMRFFGLGISGLSSLALTGCFGSSFSVWLATRGQRCYCKWCNRSRRWWVQPCRVGCTESIRDGHRGSSLLEIWRACSARAVYWKYESASSGLDQEVNFSSPN
jgi:hypothetical protein